MRRIDYLLIKRRTNGYRSFLKAVLKAGGAINAFTPKRLSKMSALELIETMGQNYIEFKFNKPE